MSTMSGCHVLDRVRDKREALEHGDRGWVPADERKDLENDDHGWISVTTPSATRREDVDTDREDAENWAFWLNAWGED
jgi:hypothetical protein